MSLNIFRHNQYTVWCYRQVIFLFTFGRISWVENLYLYEFNLIVTMKDVSVRWKRFSNCRKTKRNASSNRKQSSAMVNTKMFSNLITSTVWNIGTARRANVLSWVECFNTNSVDVMFKILPPIIAIWIENRGRKHLIRQTWWASLPENQLLQGSKNSTRRVRYRWVRQKVLGSCKLNSYI